MEQAQITGLSNPRTPGSGLAALSVIERFDICQGRGGGWVKSKAAEVRACGSYFEPQVKRNGRDVCCKDSLCFLMEGIFRIGGNRLNCLEAGSIKDRIFVARDVGAHPIILGVRDLRADK